MRGASLRTSLCIDETASYLYKYGAARSIRLPQRAPVVCRRPRIGRHHQRAPVGPKASCLACTRDLPIIEASTAEAARALAILAHERLVLIATLAVTRPRPIRAIRFPIRATPRSATAATAAKAARRLAIVHRVTAVGARRLAIAEVLPRLAICIHVGAAAAGTRLGARPRAGPWAGTRPGATPVRVATRIRVPVALPEHLRPMSRRCKRSRRPCGCATPSSCSCNGRRSPSTAVGSPPSSTCRRRCSR
mmetsp:Transcript_74592/g.215542  ORF Transcript_74592/g.215542 Transcript_74592/m.215542 type:complete len:249 (+) Transcript_74592:89-835(+)